MQQLTAHNEDLSATVETLKEELISSHEEANRYSVELDSLRNRTLHETSQETLRRERELREAQGELERCRMERDEWERAAMHEKAVLEDLKSNTDTSQRELEMLRDTHARHLVELTAEKEKSENLQSVLQDFQAGALSVYLILIYSNIYWFSERPRTTFCRERLRITIVASCAVPR